MPCATHPVMMTDVAWVFFGAALLAFGTGRCAVVVAVSATIVQATEATFRKFIVSPYSGWSGDVGGHCLPATPGAAVVTWSVYERACARRCPIRHSERVATATTHGSGWS